MTIATLILRNVTRNRRRVLLTVLSAAVSLFLFVTLQVVLRLLMHPPEDAAASLRIAVRSRVSLANPLPARQLDTIARIPGVAAVTPLTFFGGVFKDDTSVGFAQFGIDPTKLRTIFGEAIIPDEALDKFIKSKTSCILGRDTAERYKIKTGDRITLIGTIYPCDLELDVAGIYHGTIDDRNCWFHQTYLDEALDDWGQVGMWWIRAESAEAAPAAIEAINKAFANTAHEVRAETERAFQMSFVSMWGNISLLIQAISGAVVFALALVGASTMSMAIRERLRELAILKAIGFAPRELLAYILAESFLLSLAGALLGAGGAWLISRTVDINKVTGGFLPYLNVDLDILALAALIACALGIISTIAPAISILRLSVVQGLKTLD